MKVGVILQHRFIIGPEGAFWTTAGYDYDFWRRYLEVFEKVFILGRVNEARIVESYWKRACGPGVTILRVPDFGGPRAYLRSRSAVKDKTMELARKVDGVILRIPGVLCFSARATLRRSGTPFMVEVIGDPWDIFSPGAISHWSRRLLRVHQTLSQRKICKQAIGAAYVTRSALQKRYPPGPNAFTTNYSSISLNERQLAEKPRLYEVPLMVPKLVVTASLAHSQKGVDILLRGVKALRENGCKTSLRVIGGGKEKEKYRQLARDLGVGDLVTFCGPREAGDQVLNELDKADLFVLPSRQEGLPRSMIEAMARGLPCLGSNVGGIAELISADCLFPVNDAIALSERVRTITGSPGRMTAESERNLRVAALYTEKILQPRRTHFYERLREVC